MSDLPRFENVDLTPTWDDVDPAELDFGVSALDSQPIPADIEADEVALEPQPISPGADAFVQPDLEIPPGPPNLDDDVDEFEGLDDADMQFDDAAIGVDSVPEDFDLP